MTSQFFYEAPHLIIIVQKLYISPNSGLSINEANSVR